MNVKEALSIIGGLSRPSKMPGYSYGLPAWECNTGSKLRAVEGSVCHGCYALKGFYTFKNVKTAQEKRLESLKDPRWVEAMTIAVQWATRNVKYFRWHDSGDLQGVWHLRKIIEVCNRTPEIKHWMPSREYGIIKKYMKLEGHIPPNLTIRLSAHMINGTPPNFGVPTSTVIKGSVDTDSFVCPARNQNNECGSCRACWDSSVPNVAYAYH